MSYSITLGDIIEIRLGYVISGQRLLNVLHYRVSAEGSIPITNGALWMQATATFFHNDAACIVQKMLQRTTNEVSFNLTQAQKILPVRYRAAAATSAQLGDIDPPTAAQNLSRVITKFTQNSGRGETGSFHMAGFPASDYENGQFTNAVILGDSQLADALQANFTPVADQATISPIILSRRDVGVYGNIIGVIQQKSVRVMRRRTVGVGQ